MVSVKVVSIIVFVACIQSGFALHEWAYGPSPVPGSGDIFFVKNANWNEMQGRWYGQRQTNTVTPYTDGTCNHALLARFDDTTVGIDMCGQLNGNFNCGYDVGTMTLSYNGTGVNLVNNNPSSTLSLLYIQEKSGVVAITYNPEYDMTTLFGYTREPVAPAGFDELFDWFVWWAGADPSSAVTIEHNANCKYLWD